MPAKQVVTLLFKRNQEEQAKRLATILDGTDLKEVDGHLMTQVPLRNLEQALLFEEAA